MNDKDRRKVKKMVESLSVVHKELDEMCKDMEIRIDNLAEKFQDRAEEGEMQYNMINKAMLKLKESIDFLNEVSKKV